MQHINDSDLKGAGGICVQANRMSQIAIVRHILSLL